MTRPLSAPISLALALCAAGLAGCRDRAVMMPTSDPSLNKSAATFATEAAKRFPYPVDAQRGGELRARAEIGHMWNVINLVNYSGENWSDVELWVNRTYVIPLAKLETGKNKRIPFKILYNEHGRSFPDGGVMIDTLELKKDGQMFDVPKQIGG